jgi:uncharacterized UBP type Zn finger protein
MSTCEHLDQIDHEIAPSSFEGCSDCLESGGQWVHLRMCLTCGRVGCCDSSPNRHASRHAAEHGHPLISSFEPGEGWSWCFLDQVGLVIESIPHPHRLPYPGEQSAPGQP